MGLQRGAATLGQSSLDAHSTHQPDRGPVFAQAVAPSNGSQSSDTRQPPQVLAVTSHAGLLGSLQSCIVSHSTHWPLKGPSVAHAGVRSNREHSSSESQDGTHSYPMHIGDTAGHWSFRVHRTQTPSTQRSASQPSQLRPESGLDPPSGAFGFTIMPPSGRRQLQPSSDCTVSGGQTQRPSTRSSIRSPQGSAGAVLQPMTTTQERA